jgi:hypothetical protein
MRRLRFEPLEVSSRSSFTFPKVTYLGPSLSNVRTCHLSYPVTRGHYFSNSIQLAVRGIYSDPTEDTGQRAKRFRLNVFRGNAPSLSSSCYAKWDGNCRSRRNFPADAIFEA